MGGRGGGGKGGEEEGRGREREERRRGWKGEKEGGHTGGNTLHPTSTGETADGGLGDALDVVAEDLAVTFGAAFAEAFAAFTACRDKLSAWAISNKERVMME